MRKDNLTSIKKPEIFIDAPITQVLQNGTRKLIATALEVEINNFLEQYSSLLDDQGKKRITCNGYLPGREIQTGIGSIRVKAPQSWQLETEALFFGKYFPRLMKQRLGKDAGFIKQQKKISKGRNVPEKR